MCRLEVEGAALPWRRVSTRAIMASIRLIAAGEKPAPVAPRDIDPSPYRELLGESREGHRLDRGAARVLDRHDSGETSSCGNWPNSRDRPSRGPSRLAGAGPRVGRAPGSESERTRCRMS